MTTTNAPTLWLQAPTPTEGVRDSLSANEYMKMLSSTDGWATTAGQTAAFVLNIDFVLHASTADLQQVIDFLDAHDIAICLMAPVLPKGSDGTGMGLEGYGNPTALQNAVQRLASLGGDVKYFQMDEPLGHSVAINDPHAEKAPVATLAQQAAASVAIVQSVFPDVQVGQIDTAAVSASDYATFAADFQQDSGTPLSFVTLDVNWNAAQTPSAQTALVSNLESIAQSVHGAGAQFGIVDDGLQGRTSLNWVQSAEQHMAMMEADPLIRPDISLVQSWVPQPVHLLGEGAPDTLTHAALETAEIAPLYANGTLVGGKGVTASSYVPPVTEGVKGYAVGIPGIALSAQAGTTGSTLGATTFAVLLTDTTGLLGAQAKGAGTVAGAGTTTLRLTGSLADINAELATVRYQSATVGSETIDVTTYDGAGMVDDNQMTVTTLAPITVPVPASLSAAAMFTAIFGTAPTAADLAPINTAMAAGQTLTQASAPWQAQAQAEVTQALQQMTGTTPDTATVKSWMSSMLSGTTLPALRASEAGAVQGILTSLITNLAHKAPPAGQIATMAAPVVSGAQTLEQAEAQRLLSSSQAQTIKTLGQQVATGMMTTQMTEDYTREYVMGTPLAIIRGQMAALPQVNEYLTAKYYFTYGTPPTTAQLSSLTTELASGKNLSDITSQFYAAAGQQVTAAYQQVLGRAPTSTELTTFESQIELAGRTMGWVVNSLASSAEAKTTMQATLQSAFNLPPNPTDVAKLLTMLGQGTPLAEIRTDLTSMNSFTVHTTGAAATSSEVSTMVGELAAGTPLPTIQQDLATSTGTRQLVSAQYQTAYGVAATPTTVDSLTGELAGGKSFTQVSAEIGQSAAADKPVIGSFAAHETVAPNGKLLPLAATTLTDPALQQTETATVSITAGLGKLASGAAQVSADGLRATVTGGAGYVQGVLQKLVLTPGTPGGSGTLTLSVKNGAGNTSAATAQISVDTVSTTAKGASFLPASNGADQLTGSSGADVFMIPATSTGSHVITGFDPAHDILDLPKSVVPTMAVLQSDMKSSAGGAMINLGTHGTRPALRHRAGQPEREQRPLRLKPSSGRTECSAGDTHHP